MHHQFTIGIEEEYQIIDVESRDLVSHVSKIIEGGKAVLSENLKHEMHESMIEMETGICQNIQEARAELTNLRRHLINIAHEQGLRVSGGGTHPFSHWSENNITQEKDTLKSWMIWEMWPVKILFSDCMFILEFLIVKKA